MVFKVLRDLRCVVAIIAAVLFMNGIARNAYSDDLLPAVSARTPSAEIPKTSPGTNNKTFGLDRALEQQFFGENAPMRLQLDSTMGRKSILSQYRRLFLELNKVAHGFHKESAGKDADWNATKIAELRAISANGVKERSIRGVSGDGSIIKSLPSLNEQAIWVQFEKLIRLRIEDVMKSSDFDPHSFDDMAELYHELYIGVDLVLKRDQQIEAKINEIKQSANFPQAGNANNNPATSDSGKCCRKRKRCTLELLF